MEKMVIVFFAVVKRQDRVDPKIIAQKQDFNLFNKGALEINEPDPSNSTEPQTNPIKLKTGYGICLNLNCGSKDPRSRF